jgi:hypothetical protein
MSFEYLLSRLRSPAGVCSALFVGASIAGCGGSDGPSSVDVDADGVAARAIELYDANSDGGIDADEAKAKCPPLAAAFARFDSDSDGKLTASEVSARVGALAQASGAMIGIECSVLQNGRPFADAVLKLRPAEMYGDSLLPAEGTADATGRVTPSVGDDHLPPKLAGMSLMYPGLYHAEITHPQAEIPARYNTATELGCEVDPLSRTGVQVKFDLKSN